MPDPVDRPRLAAANIVALVVWGVALSFWMLRYTDWFPVVGGLLGLTGAFTWVAFLANIVPEARKQAFQGWFDRRVLQRWWPIGLLSGLSLAFLLLFTSWHGTLILDTLGDGVPRTVALTRLGDEGAVAPLRFGSAARAEQKLLLPTAPLRPTAYRLKLSGLPAFTVEVAPWRRRTVVVPSEVLTSPVVLLRPTATMSGEASSGEFALLVQADGQEFGRLMDYRGESVWIGAEGDVEVPAAAIDRWRLELISRGLPTALVQRWTAPRSLVGERPLAAGTTIIATILRDPDALGTAEAGVQGEATARLKPHTSSADFPQEMVIDVWGAER
jgi:hypothetical protein